MIMQSWNGTRWRMGGFELLQVAEPEHDAIEKRLDAMMEAGDVEDYWTHDYIEDGVILAVDAPYPDCLEQLGYLIKDQTPYAAYEGDA